MSPRRGHATAKLTASRSSRSACNQSSTSCPCSPPREGPRQPGRELRRLSTSRELQLYSSSVSGYSTPDSSEQLRCSAKGCIVSLAKTASDAMRERGRPTAPVVRQGVLARRFLITGLTGPCSATGYLSGVGKERLARWLHDASRRCRGPTCRSIAARLRASGPAEQGSARVQSRAMVGGIPGNSDNVVSVTCRI